MKLQKYEDPLYKEEEVLVPIDQTKDALFTLHDIGDRHDLDIFNYFSRFGYDYARGLRTCTYVHKGVGEACNLEDVIDRMKTPFQVKENFMLSIKDGRHRRAAIMRINEERDGDRHE